MSRIEVFFILAIPGALLVLFVVGVHKIVRSLIRLPTELKRPAVTLVIGAPLLLFFALLPSGEYQGGGGFAICSPAYLTEGAFGGVFDDGTGVGLFGPAKTDHDLECDDRRIRDLGFSVLLTPIVTIAGVQFVLRRERMAAEARSDA
ncbi:hypothetical protein ACFW3Z_14370 [Nocardiopsis alba]|uniref:hypothetical protein n=1 Tax=Nocardiopsis alba TaxID=53437 RepID=UPI0033A64BB1